MRRGTTPDEEADIRRFLSYDAETGRLHWIASPTNSIKVGDQAGAISPRSGYVAVRFRGRSYLAHRLAFLLEAGAFPADPIDHIDGVKSNNSFKNLRVVTNNINAQNIRAAKSSNKSSGLLGAYYHKRSGRWMSTILVNAEHKYLGLFDTPEQAHEAYVAAKRAHHPGCTI